MDKKQRLIVYDQADELWGHIAQYDQCIEEMGELIVAINKYKRKVLYNEHKNNEKAEANLFEELADVFMCVEQLIQFFPERNFDEMLNKKMNKLMEEIEYMKNLPNGK